MTRNRPSRGTIGGSPGSVIFTICGCATPHVIDWSACGEPPGGVVTVAKRQMLASIASWTPGEGQTTGVQAEARAGVVRTRRSIADPAQRPVLEAPELVARGRCLLALAGGERRLEPPHHPRRGAFRVGRLEHDSRVARLERLRGRLRWKGTRRARRARPRRAGAVSSASTTAAPAAEPASAAARARRAPSSRSPGLDGVGGEALAGPAALHGAVFERDLQAQVRELRRGRQHRRERPLLRTPRWAAARRRRAARPSAPRRWCARRPRRRSGPARRANSSGRSQCTPRSPVRRRRASATQVRSDVRRPRQAVGLVPRPWPPSWGYPRNAATYVHAQPSSMGRSPVAVSSVTARNLSPPRRRGPSARPPPWPPAPARRSASRPARACGAGQGSRRNTAVEFTVRPNTLSHLADRRALQARLRPAATRTAHGSAAARVGRRAHAHPAVPQRRLLVPPPARSGALITASAQHDRGRRPAGAPRSAPHGEPSATPPPRRPPPTSRSTRPPRRRTRSPNADDQLAVRCRRVPV